MTRARTTSQKRSTKTGKGPAIRAVIHPNQVFTIPQLLQALPWLNQTTLDREIRLKRLHCARIAKRRVVMGKWVLRWIEERGIPEAN